MLDALAQEGEKLSALWIFRRPGKVIVSRHLLRQLPQLCRVRSWNHGEAALLKLQDVLSRGRAGAIVGIGGKWFSAGFRGRPRNGFSIDHIKRSAVFADADRSRIPARGN